MTLPNSYPIEIIETEDFISDVNELLTAEELAGLKAYLASNPEAGDVIPGTNGVRKLRWGIRSRNIGKRGGVRVIYYYRDLNMPVFLLAIYAKGQKTDLKETEKREYRTLIEALIKEHNEQVYASVLQLVVDK